MKNTRLFYAVLFIAAIMVSSCEDKAKEEIKGLTENNITLKGGDTHQLSYVGQEGAVEWSSDNKFIATVKDGLVSGKLAGETKIHANDDVCDVKVEPLHTAYFDPCIEWGAGQNAVVNHMVKYGQNLVKQDGNCLMYDLGYGVVTKYLYQFENGGLANVGLASSTVYVEELAEHFASRYILVDEDKSKNAFYLTNPDMNMMVAMQIVDMDNILIVYMPVSNQECATPGNYVRNFGMSSNSLANGTFDRISAILKRCAE